MTTVPIPKAIKVTCVYTLNTQRMINVYYVTNGAVATLANCITVAGLFKTWENGTNKPLRSNGTNMVSIDAAAMDGAGSPIYTLPVLPVIVGTGGGGAQASYISIAVKHTTGLGGRSYRGRTYWIGLNGSSIVGADYISTGYQANISGSYTTLRSQLATAGYTMGVASLYSGVDVYGQPIPRVTGFLTPILSSDCGVALDTQRHRKVPGVI